MRFLKRGKGRKSVGLFALYFKFRTEFSFEEINSHIYLPCMNKDSEKLGIEKASNSLKRKFLDFFQEFDF